MDSKIIAEARQEFIQDVINKNYFQNRDKIIRKSKNQARCVLLLSARSLIYKNDHSQDFEELQRNKIEKWFDDIYNSKNGSKLLDAASQCEHLAIVFDFGSENVDYVDMESTGSLGTTYTAFKWIFIGAKSTADNNRDQQIKGILAHEICHYVMKMIYENNEKPYLKGDNLRKQKYSEIVEMYRKWKEGNDNFLDDFCEGIISTVYSCYAEDDQHAELAVRPVNIYGHYDNNLSKIEELEQMYDLLFDYYEEFVIPDMKVLNVKHREKVRQFNKDCGGFCEAVKSEVKDPEDHKLQNYKNFNDLIRIREFGQESSNNGPNFERIHDNKGQATSCIVATVNVPHLFIPDLYRHLYEQQGSLLDVKNILISPENLKNEQISNDFEEILEEIHDLTIYVDCTEKLLNDFAFLSKSDSSNFIFIVLPKNNSVLQQKLKESNINPTIISYNYSYSNLTSKFQQQLLQHKLTFQDNKNFSISELFSTENLIAVNIEEIFDANFLNFLFENSRISINQAEIDSKSEDQNFNILFRSRNIIEQQKGSEISRQINQDQLLLDVIGKKIILFSDKAGSGKSWMLRNIANILKVKNSTKWITFVDLKQFINAFEAGEAGNFEDFMVKWILKPAHNFEASIFKNLYRMGKVCILFDGFDEIAPYYAEFVSELAKSFDSNGGNQLWITTRTFFEVDLQKKLELDIVFKLDPFTEQDGIELIATSLVLNEAKVGDIKSIEDVKKSPNFSKNHKIAQDLSKKILALEVRFIGFPLFFKMIIDILRNKKDATFALTILKIYSEFISIQYTRWSHDKGEIRKAANIETSNSSIDYMDVHHFFAMCGLFPGKSSYCGLEIQEGDWIDEEIIACGMLYKIGNDFLFLHETFREFCAADFIIKKLKRSKADKELCEYLIKFLTVRKFGIIRMFLNEALAEEPVKRKIALKLPEIAKILTEKIEDLVNLSDIFDEGLEGLVDLLNGVFKSGSYANFCKIIQNNQEILTAMTKNDEIFVKFQDFLVSFLSFEKLEDFLAAYTAVDRILTSSLNPKTVKDFISTLEQHTSQEFIKKQLTMKHKDESNLISRIFNSRNLNYEKFEQLLDILEAYLTSQEMVDIIKHSNTENWNILHLCADSKSPDKLKILRRIVDALLVLPEFSETFNSLLQGKTTVTNLSPLMLSASCNQVDFQVEFWTILLNYFNNLEELKNLILQKDSNDNSYIHHLVTSNQPDIIEMIFSILTQNFSDIQYQAIVHTKGHFGRNILQKAASSSKNKKIHQIIWKIVENSCKSSQEFLKILNEVDNNGSSIFYIAAAFSTGEIFEFIVEEYLKVELSDKICKSSDNYGQSSEESSNKPSQNNPEQATIRKIFQTLNKWNKNLLQCAANQNKSIHIHEVLWKIIEKNFSSHEIIAFCKHCDSYDKNVLMYALEKNGKDVIEAIWQNIFETIKKINFTDRELLMKVKLCDGFVNKVLQGEKLRDKELEILKLQFLSDENLDKISLFLRYCHKEEVKLVVRNLSDLVPFTDNRSIEDHEALWVQLPKIDKKLNDLMAEHDKNNNSYIHLLVSKNSGSVLELTFNKLSKHLNEAQFLNILQSKGYFDRNLLQRAAQSSKDIKIHQTLWTTVKKYLKIEDFVNILTDSSTKSSNFFHILVFNSTNEIFDFYIKEIQQIFNSNQIRNFLLKLNSSGRSLLQTASFQNKSLRLHQSLWNIFEQNFDYSELLEICTKFDNYGKNLILSAVEKNSKEVVDFLWSRIVEIISGVLDCEEIKLTEESATKILPMAQNQLQPENITLNLQKTTKIIQKFLELSPITTDEKDSLKLNWIQIKSEKFFSSIHDFSDHPIKSLTNLVKFTSDPKIENHEALWNHLLELYSKPEELMNIMTQKDSSSNNYIHLIVGKSQAAIIQLTFDKLRYNLNDTQYHQILNSKGYFDRNLLHRAACLTKNIEIHKILWSTFQNSCKSDKDFLDIITAGDENGNNVINVAAIFSTGEIIEFMISKLQEKFSTKEIRKILTALTKKNRNLLQSAAINNKSLCLHQSLWKIIGTYFDSAETLQFIKHFDVSQVNLLYTVIRYNIKDVIEFTWKEISKVVHKCSTTEGNLMENMKTCDEIVSKAFKFGSIKRDCYEILELNWIDDKNPNIFEDLCVLWLQKRMPITTLDDLLIFISNKNLEIHQKLWNFLLDANKNKEELKNLLVQKNKNQSNFLHLLVQRNTPDVIAITVKNLKQHLTDIQFQEIFKSRGPKDRNILMEAAFNKGDIKTLQILWHAVHEMCESDEKFIEFIEEVEKLDNNVLHIAAIFASAEVFEFMMKEFEQIATKEKIRHLLSFLNLNKRNLLQSAARRNKNVELHKKLWEIYEKYFDCSELLEFITYIDEDFETILSTAIKANCKSVIDVIWNRIEDCIIAFDIDDPIISQLRKEYNKLILNISEGPLEITVKKNLLHKWKELESILRTSNATKVFERILFLNMKLDDFEAFFRVAACDIGEYHERLWFWFFSLIENRDVIKHSILQKSNIGICFLVNMLRYSTPKIVEYLISLWQLNLEQDQFQEILEEKAVFNTNLLQKAAYCTRNIETHKFLWKLYRNSCSSNSDFLKILADEDKFVFNVIMVVAMFNSGEILNFMIEELEKIATREEIRRLLASFYYESTFNRHFLLSAVNRNKSLEFHQTAWTVLKNYLTKPEILQIINYLEDNIQSHNTNLLGNAIFWNSKEVAEYTWMEIKNYIPEKEDQAAYLKKNVKLNILELALDNEFDSDMMAWAEELVCEYNISFNG